MELKRSQILEIASNDGSLLHLIKKNINVLFWELIQLKI